MHKVKITDEQLIYEYTINKIGMSQIAKKFNMRVYAIEKRINSLAKKGVLTKNKPNTKKTDSTHPHIARSWDKEIPYRIIDDYKNGLGIKALSTKYGIRPGKIRYHLIKIGIYNHGNGCTSKNSGFTGRQRSRDKRRWSGFEFTYKTKKEAYALWEGNCSWCGLKLPDFWKIGTSYHHIIKINDGGCGSVDNCAPMHRACHEDPIAFKLLHEFDKRYLYKKNKEKNAIHLAA